MRKPKAETAPRAMKVGKHPKFRLWAETLPLRRGQLIRVEIEPSLSPRDAAKALRLIATDLDGADKAARRDELWGAESAREQFKWELGL